MERSIWKVLAGAACTAPFDPCYWVKSEPGHPKCLSKVGAQRPGCSHPGRVPSFFHHIAVPQSSCASLPHLHSCDQMLSVLLQNEVYMVQEKWHLPNGETHLKAGEREMEKERKREREREREREKHQFYTII